tara:strand:- start:561 stop:887 length:327 start_codon:yes stop_codon:yes gene_type:complete
MPDNKTRNVVVKKVGFSNVIGTGPTTSLLIITTSVAVISPREIPGLPVSGSFGSRTSKLISVSLKPDISASLSVKVSHQTHSQLNMFKTFQSPLNIRTLKMLTEQGFS